MVDREWSESVSTCVNLVKQDEIYCEELEKIYDCVTNPGVDKEFTSVVLCAMAEREDLTNKLLNHSHKVGEIIADTYLGFLRVDFSQGQTE